MSVLAEGKTYAELLDMAKRDRREFWPRVVVALLRRIYELETEAQKTRQGELFAPPSSNVNGRPVHE